MVGLRSQARNSGLPIRGLLPEIFSRRYTKKIPIATRISATVGVIQKLQGTRPPSEDVYMENLNLAYSLGRYGERVHGLNYQLETRFRVPKRTGQEPRETYENDILDAWLDGLSEAA